MQCLRRKWGFWGQKLQKNEIKNEINRLFGAKNGFLLSKRCKIYEKADFWSQKLQKMAILSSKTLKMGFLRSKFKLQR